MCLSYQSMTHSNRVCCRQHSIEFEAQSCVLSQSHICSLFPSACVAQSWVRVISSVNDTGHSPYVYSCKAQLCVLYHSRLYMRDWRGVAKHNHVCFINHGFAAYPQPSSVHVMHPVPIRHLSMSRYHRLSTSCFSHSWDRDYYSHTFTLRHRDYYSHTFTPMKKNPWE